MFAEDESKGALTMGIQDDMMGGFSSGGKYMQISSSLGMSIVTEVKEIIHEDRHSWIRGYHIIACTDERRIGRFAMRPAGDAG